MKPLNIGPPRELFVDDYKPLPGYSVDDCNEFWGDEIEGSVTWKEKPTLDIANDKPIRLRFVMSDADIYALRFL